MYREFSLGMDQIAFAVGLSGGKNSWLPLFPLNELHPLFALASQSWPSKAHPHVYDLCDVPFDDSSRRNVIISKLESAKSKIPDFNLIEAELENTIFPEISSLPILIENPASATIFSPKYGETTLLGRLWYVIGRIQAYEGKPKRSLKTMMCILLSGNKFGNKYDNYKFIIDDMNETYLTKIGASGLLEIAPDLKLSKRELQKVFQLLGEIENKSHTFLTALESERAVFLNFSADFWALLKKPSVRHSGEIYYSYLEAFSDMELLKSILSITHDPLIQAVKEPYSAAIPKINAHRLQIIEQMKRHTKFGVHWIGYFFCPERYFLERSLFLALENSLFNDKGSFLSVYRKKIRSIEYLHGAKIALALYSYKNEIGTWPGDLNILEKWVGASFPLDLYSEKQHFFQVSTAPVLISVGEDLKPQTTDDLLFVPVWNDYSFSAVASSFATNIATESIF
ncbi:hypothetical protein HYY75_02925 [bacterium]|nr:hypothetical protein [bacterium]